MAWTPANITNPAVNVPMWLDPSVSSTLLDDADAEAVDGVEIKTVNSRAGTTGHSFTQPTAAKRGVLNTTNLFGTTPCIDFQGIAGAGYNGNTGPNYMDASDAGYAWGTAWTLVMLLRPVNNIAGYARIFDQTFGTNMMLGLNSAATGFASFVRGSELSFVATVGADCILTQRFAPDGTHTFRRNGGTNSAIGTATAPASSTRDCQLAWDVASSASPLGFRLYSAVWTLDTSDNVMYRLEGYMSWIVGNSDLLPIGHAYKSAAPEIAGGGMLSRSRVRARLGRGR